MCDPAFKLVRLNFATRNHICHGDFPIALVRPSNYGDVGNTWVGKQKSFQFRRRDLEALYLDQLF